MYFFHGLTLGLSVRVVRFFWITAGFLVIAWIYAVVNFVVICAHFGADAGQSMFCPLLRPEVLSSYS